MTVVGATNRYPIPVTVSRKALSERIGDLARSQNSAADMAAYQENSF